jgi:predicted RNase H-like HicB family nuclease
MKTHQIRAVLFEDMGWWCVQCLEHDIAAQARTVSELVTELERVLSAHVEVSAQLEHEPFVDLPPAPQRFFDAYESSRTPVEDERRQAYGNEQVLSIEPTIRYAEPTLLSR